METFTLKTSSGRDLRITGAHIGSASTSDDRSDSDYSGDPGRWTEMELYRTESGKFVCRISHMTRWQGESDRHTVEVCETLDELFEFAGDGSLACRLYADAGIDFVEVVE